MLKVDEVLEENGIEYRNQGRDYLVRCLSPDHDDNNPSMRIDSINGVFHCLSCGFAGNIFEHFDAPKNELGILRDTIRQKIEEITYETVGVQKPKNFIPYREEYRGIPPELWREFDAFICPNDHDFKDRIWVPITHLSGKTAAFIGRDVTGTHTKQKYKVFPRKAKVPLFPLDKVQERVILVEGLFDMLNLHKQGHTNTLATFGTNTVTDEKISLLKTLGVLEVVILFDGDKAGRAGAYELADRLQSKRLSHRIVHLPDGSDPGDIDNISEYL